MSVYPGSGYLISFKNSGYETHETPDTRWRLIPTQLLVYIYITCQRWLGGGALLFWPMKEPAGNFWDTCTLDLRVPEIQRPTSKLLTGDGSQEIKALLLTLDPWLSKKLIISGLDPQSRAQKSSESGQRT